MRLTLDIGLRCEIAYFLPLSDCLENVLTLGFQCLVSYASSLVDRAHFHIISGTV